MRLKSLKLEQYRNYEALSLTFDANQHITTIVGQNGQGKTNILEAIYLLALTKSFRTSKQQDLIQWEKDYCRVRGVFETSEQSLELETFYGIPPQPTRSLKKNGVKTSNVKFIGNCQIVFFHPEDLNMLYLGPDLRRRYLDILNIQVNPHYYAALRSYKRILTQRNSLLKLIKEGHSTIQDLEIWDQQLVEQAEKIIEERRKTVRFLNERISEMYRKISQQDHMVEVEYLCALSGCTTMEEALQKAQTRDLQAEFTTVGPHRDDISFLLNGRSLPSHASRGEYRSLLLTMKLLELNMYEETTGEKPILLLDDVFSELDPVRQTMLLENIEGYQTLITTTHIEDHLAERSHAGLQKVEKGTLSPVNA